MIPVSLLDKFRELKGYLPLYKNEKGYLMQSRSMGDLLHKAAREFGL